MLKGVNLAIAELIKLCTRSASESIRLAAGRTLLQHWIKAWEEVYFEGIGRKLIELEAEKRGGTLPGKWRPCVPWGPKPEN
jgi:hypothetical protein